MWKKFPEVIGIDNTYKTKNALDDYFPSAQQQLCVYHINTNFRSRIRSRWKDGSDQTATAPENSDGPAEQDGPTEEDLDLAVAMMNDIETEGLDAATAGDDEHSIDSMFKLWQQVIHAPTKTDFDNAWKAMEDQYKDQQHTLDYISDEYMPLLHQWAKYEIDQYRNFGQRVNSPTESSHRQLKTFLKSGTGHLHYMHIAITDIL
ncbi:hypothetical protein E4U59_002660 [Claviceps monticola]|nr:hypothetical protein E4U59_002660 [Claviceps monticola]